MSININIFPLMGLDGQWMLSTSPDLVAHPPPSAVYAYLPPHTHTPLTSDCHPPAHLHLPQHLLPYSSHMTKPSSVFLPQLREKVLGSAPLISAASLLDVAGKVTHYKYGRALLFRLLHKVKMFILFFSRLLDEKREYKEPEVCPFAYCWNMVSLVFIQII